MDDIEFMRRYSLTASDLDKLDDPEYRAQMLRDVAELDESVTLDMLREEFAQWPTR